MKQSCMAKLKHFPPFSLVFAVMKIAGCFSLALLSFRFVLFYKLIKTSLSLHPISSVEKASSRMIFHFVCLFVRCEFFSISHINVYNDFPTIFTASALLSQQQIFNFPLSHFFFFFFCSNIDTEARDMEVKHFTSATSSVFTSWRELKFLLNLKFSLFALHYIRLNLYC